METSASDSVVVGADTIARVREHECTRLYASTTTSVHGRKEAERTEYTAKPCWQQIRYE